MTRRAFPQSLAISILMSQLSFAQEARDTSTQPRCDTGMISKQRYTNECFGFTLAIPAGREWQNDR